MVCAKRTHVAIHSSVMVIVSNISKHRCSSCTIQTWLFDQHQIMMTMMTKSQAPSFQYNALHVVWRMIWWNPRMNPRTIQQCFSPIETWGHFQNNFKTAHFDTNLHRPWIGIFIWNAYEEHRLWGANAYGSWNMSWTLLADEHNTKLDMPKWMQTVLLGLMLPCANGIQNRLRPFLSCKWSRNFESKLHTPVAEAQISNGTTLLQICHAY